MSNYTSTTPTPKIKASYKNESGEMLYQARIETIHYDHSPRNPSLPVVDTIYNGKPTVEYGLTYSEACFYLSKFGFLGPYKPTK